MGEAGYSEMAHMLGLYDVREICRYSQENGGEMEEMANEGDHYRLAFGP